MVEGSPIDYTVWMDCPTNDIPNLKKVIYPSGFSFKKYLLMVSYLDIIFICYCAIEINITNPNLKPGLENNKMISIIEIYLWHYS
jgi:hypothetical protein